jgi:stress-induced-phosphoprotein 1
LKNYEKALEDAEKCISILPSWGKGFQRKGMALHGLKKWEDAMAALAKGAELDPTNAQIKTAMDNLRRDF